MSGLNKSLAQQFSAVTVSNLYNNLRFIDQIKSNQALLLYTIQPDATLTSATIVTYKDISKLLPNSSVYNRVASYGRYYVDNDVRYVVSLIDAESFYVQTFPETIQIRLLPALQQQLVAVGLGTVQSRRAYISLITSGSLVSPVDFRGYLQPWIVSGLVIAILIPAWFLMRRFLRG